MMLDDEEDDDEDFVSNSSKSSKLPALVIIAGEMGSMNISSNLKPNRVRSLQLSESSPSNH